MKEKLLKYVTILSTFIALLCFSFDILRADTGSETGSISSKINEAAVHALDNANYSNQNGIVKLYGVRTNGPDTKNGNWACAKVVSIVLNEVGVLNELYVGVSNVESALNSWTEIKKEDDLLPGDIIVWVSRFKGRDDKKCTGGGNCHVGIVTAKGYFHNNPITNKPTFGGISLWGFSFKMGYRYPKSQTLKENKT